MHKLEKDSAPLRAGSVDLETGVVDGAIGPEVRAQALFDDRYVAVVRAGHALCTGVVTRSRYCAAHHVHIARRDHETSHIDQTLAALGLRREVVTTVAGYSAALALARDSDLVASVPERHTGILRAGMDSFALPLPVAPFTVAMLWHPRMDGEAAEPPRLLRRLLRSREWSHHEEVPEVFPRGC